MCDIWKQFWSGVVELAPGHGQPGAIMSSDTDRQALGAINKAFSFLFCTSRVTASAPAEFRWHLCKMTIAKPLFFFFFPLWIAMSPETNILVIWQVSKFWRSAWFDGVCPKTTLLIPIQKKVFGTLVFSLLNLLVSLLNILVQNRHTTDDCEKATGMNYLRNWLFRFRKESCEFGSFLCNAESH